MARLAVMIAAVVVSASCKQVDPDYCFAHPGIEGCSDAGSTGGHCKTSANCPDKMHLPDCETMAGPHVNTCVQCTANEHALCTGTTPTCKDDSCVACAHDNDCGNGIDSLCLPNGACALLTDVAYVDGTNGVDGTQCTMNQPCTRIDAAAALKPVVKVSGAVKNRCSLTGTTTTILAQAGATLIPTGGGLNDGPALEIRGASHVEVYDLEIDQATGGTAKDGSGVLVADTAEVLMTRVKLSSNSQDGAHVTGGHFTCTLCTISQNANLGIDAAGGVLTVSQSTIRDNLSGGININSTGGSFQIVGNVIFRNGQPTRLTGGISIAVDGSSTNRLDFNSFSRNTAIANSGQNIRCDSGMPLTASNNIVWDTGSTSPEVSGGCTYAYSDIGPLPIQTGTNMTVSPLFKDENTGDLHLMSTSPVRRMADPVADLKGLAAYDIDGEPRLPPRVDLGADQTP